MLYELCCLKYQRRDKNLTTAKQKSIDYHEQHIDEISVEYQVGPGRRRSERNWLTSSKTADMSAQL